MPGILITERDFLRWAIDLAKFTGWRVAHFRPAMTAKGGWITRMDGHYGFPDLVLVRPPRIIFAELKRKKGGATTPDQDIWLTQLGLVPGLEVYLWTPEQREEIVRILTHLRAPVTVRE